MQRSIFIDLFLTLITGGIWNFYVQYRQMSDLGKYHNKEYSFFLWLILSILTFGLYHIYHEYKMTKDILTLSKSDNIEILSIAAAIATMFALWFIVDTIQQAILNDLEAK
tara:strand:- start:1789 stop:2118 length:330 start_codon:yes stop_codon:yes gene_type:complete